MRRRPLVFLLVPVAAVLGACSSAPTSRGQQAAPTASTPASTAGPTEPPPTATPGWLTYDHDPQRSGYDPTSPPPSGATAIRPAWTSAALDGAVYAQPLVTSQAVVVATENDTVYSLSPSTGAVQWERHLATPVQGSALPCGDIDPSGITGTPVIDPTTRLVWVVTFSGPPMKHTLWALRLADGAVAASKPADPPDSNPAIEQQRGALALTGNRVYVPYGGLYGDCGNYHGAVVGLSTATGARQTGQGALTYWTPAGKGGIWSPPGPVVDADGSLLIATGNGAPATPPGDANSVIRLTPDLTVRAIFTAPDFVSLSESDRDLGSTSPSLVNGEVLQVGKEGIGYLLDSGLHLTNSAKVCAGGFGGTAVSGNTVFLPCFDGLFALQITPEGIDVRWKVASIRPGPPIVAGGAVWTVGLNGRLDGFDERSGRRVYGHAIAVAGSFPTLAAYNGVLYVPDGDRVAAFGGV